MTSQTPSPPGEASLLGIGWWIKQCLGLAMTIVLMVVLGAALSMLTRMLIEGTTTPDAHLPTVIFWFILCSVPIVGGSVVQMWRQLKDERVHVDVFGNELRIDRWSAASEREQFAARVAADERARDRGQAKAAPTDPPAVRAEATTSQESRAAALRRREVVPDLESSLQTGRWSGPLHRLRRVALICLYAWVPVAVVVAFVYTVLPPSLDRIWGLLPLLLLPLGWALMEAHYVLRHRWLRTRESRSDLAGVHVVSAWVGIVVFAMLALTGLIMRSEFLGVALICIPLMALCVWLLRREMRHQLD